MTTSQKLTTSCDCCGLPVDPLTTEDCPRCHYPVNPDKEEHFLQSAIADLQRVVAHGGADLRVTDLIKRYQYRLSRLQQHHIQAAPVPQIPIFTEQKPARTALAQPSVPHGPEQAQVPPVPVIPLFPEEGTPVAAAGAPERPRPARHVFSWRSFFADQAITILASLGAFLILVGALSFTATTSNLLLSFVVVFAVHAVFGITGFITYRFRSFRTVAIIYTVIFALLVPLVGFSLYRLLVDSHIAFSLPVLVALAALYAAIVYTILAIYQRFPPFAYSGMVALLLADLAAADALTLAYWWWPSAALLLALAALVSLRQLSAHPEASPLAAFWTVFRNPMRFVMYALVLAVTLSLLYGISYSLRLDLSGTPNRELRFAILSVLALLLVWTGLALWLTKRTQWLLTLAYLLLATVLTFCYALAFEPIGYALALTGLALLYHGSNRFAGRFLQPFGKLSLGLDQLALVLVFLVPCISSPLLPVQLFARAYAPSSMAFQANWQALAELIAVGAGILLTISVSTSRAGFSRAPVKAAWCWVLLLSGFLLNGAYSLVVLALHIEPVWPFLGLSLLLVAIAVSIRRLFGAAWANVLDVLALFGVTLTLSLSLNQQQDVISALLLGFGTLLYVVLLYQRRQNWLFLPLTLALLALPLLWNRPVVMFLISMLLPLISMAIRRLIPSTWHVSHAALLDSLSLSERWEWPVVGAGLVYGIMFSVYDVFSPVSALQHTLGMTVPVALELALLSLSWYAAAALARVKPWLVPSVGFALGALLLPSNAFWVLVGLTPVLALAGIGISRFVGRDWALPLYLPAILSAVMTGYTGFAQQHLLAAAWALLGFAALAYIIGVIEQVILPLWLMPVFATWSIIISAGFLNDLYRPPIVALLAAGLGVYVGLLSRLSLPSFGLKRKGNLLAYALPFYATALTAAVLTGVYGTLANINRPFYGAVPDALLFYAVVAFVVLVIERQPRWVWLAAGFAIWGTLLALQLSAYYLLGIGIGTAVAGLLVGQVMKRPATKTRLPIPLQTMLQFTWSWPWYVTALLAAGVTGIWTLLPVDQPFSGFIGYSLLAFTAIALVIMLLERVPELLLFPAGLAAWTIWHWQPSPGSVSLMIAYSLLCAVVFVSQFLWQVIPSASRWLPARIPHLVLGLVGQGLVVLAIIGQGGLSPASGQLVHVGAAALLELALLLFWTGSLLKGVLVPPGTAGNDKALESEQLQRAKAIQHACSYTAGLLLSLVVSWELSAFHQTRFDVLALAPASYLSVIAPFLMRDESLPQRRLLGQFAALLGAALLLLPALWFSFSDTNLAPTLVLVGESLALLLLGIATRVRIFLLSSASLLVVGTLRALFLSAPLSLALMGLGGILIALATVLFLVRHRLKVAWKQWQ